jgi:hypothetical protein
LTAGPGAALGELVHWPSQASARGPVSGARGLMSGSFTMATFGKSGRGVGIG